MAFAGSLQKGQVSVLCQLCDVDTGIQFKCIDCTLLMCTKCKEKVHPRLKNAADHRVLDITEIGETSDFRFCDFKCESHESQQCCLYCKSCKQLRCVKCTTKIHSGHAFVDEDEFKSKKRLLKDKQDEIGKRYENLVNVEESLNMRKDMEHINYIKAQNEIRSQQTAIEKKLKEEVNKAMTELDEKWKSVEQAIQTELSRVKTAKTAAQECRNVIENLDTLINVADFFEDFDKLSLSISEEIPTENISVPSVPMFVPANISHLQIGNWEQKNAKTKPDMKPKLEVVRTLSTELSYVHCLTICHNGSIWLADNKNNIKLQHITLDSNNIQITSCFDMKIYGLAVTSSNDVLLSCGTTSLKQIEKKTGQIEDKKYSVTPMITRGLHVCNDKIFICARSPGQAFPRSGRRLVVVLDQEGKLLREYEYDVNKQPLFTVPLCITTTSNGYIWVIDILNATFKGRIVILGKEVNVKGIYEGHPDINDDDNPFAPMGIVTTPSDNVIITDMSNHLLHILDGKGQLISCAKTDIMGIIYPYSLGISSPNKLLIGCVGPINRPKDFKAKLYEIVFSGF